MIMKPDDLALLERGRQADFLTSLQCCNPRNADVSFAVSANDTSASLVMRLPRALFRRRWSSDNVVRESRVMIIAAMKS